MRVAGTATCFPEQASDEHALSGSFVEPLAAVRTSLAELTSQQRRSSSWTCGTKPLSAEATAKPQRRKRAARCTVGASSNPSAEVLLRGSERGRWAHFLRIGASLRQTDFWKTSPKPFPKIAYDDHIQLHLRGCKDCSAGPKRSSHGMTSHRLKGCQIQIPAC